MIVSHLIKIAFAIGASFLILSMLIYLVSTGHDPTQRPQIIELVTSTSLVGLLTYLPLQLLALVTRAVRYRILINAAGESNTPRLGAMILVTGIRNMVVDLLPARIGELGYVALLNRGYQVSAAACLSSLGISVLFDFIALGLIILIALLWQLGGQGESQWLIGAMLMAGIAVAIAYWGLVAFLPWVQEKINTRVSASSGGLWQRVIDLLVQVNQAIATTRQSGVFIKILGLSMVIRILKYTGLYFLFIAVISASLPNLAAVSGIKIFSALVGAEIGASLPVPTFMSFGSYEAGGTLVFSLLGLTAHDGLLAILGVHIWSQIMDYGVGGLCLIILVFTLGRIPRRIIGDIKEWRRRWLYGVALGLFLVGTAALAWQYRSNLKLGATSAPPVGEDLSAQISSEVDITRLALLESNISGFVIWSSNRFGNHDLLRLSLQDGQLTRLTDHPHTETWPRISPDGEQIIFARSLQPWVSQRNSVAWEIVLLELQSGDQTILATNASYPFWIDANTVGYLFQGNQVIRHTLSNNARQVHYRSGEQNSMPVGANITSPDVSPLNGELVFTARQQDIGSNDGFWGTAIWQNQGTGGGPITSVHEGCELNWSSDGRWLYQVGHGGKQKTMLYRLDPKSLNAEPLLDLPGPYSHEYWPEDSNDGQYLVFGASQGEHEHDVADYEIFLWHIGSPVEDAMRLTFHSGNDNWPDVYINNR